MNTQGKILLADDEPDILEIVSYNLAAEGYEVICAKNGNEALALAKEQLPSMIILDIMMPGKNGIDVCKILRLQPQFKDTVIIFLSALGDENTEIRGLETGADDYITKPISPKVLISKVNALFRRVTKEDNKILQLGDLSINREKYNVTFKNIPIILARKEFELLSLLASKPGKVFLRNEILEKVWGTEVIVGDRTIDVHVRKIRQKIGVDCISTVKGVGYKFEL
ncbi:MAG: response regulator transcription factor [Chitinophagaceae bacterium]|nr:response regulator transcription factor [Chitinophagaceae bacterium]